METIECGVTMENANGRYGSEDLKDRVCITVIDKEIEYKFYFKIPGLWTNAIVDMYDLVNKAYPDAEVTVDIIG